jgi:hypothetical protein
MEIPAKLVIRKMEDELVKLKESLDESSGGGASSQAAYREHAQALKTYCDLLLDSGSSRVEAPPKVQHASVDDVKAKMSQGLTDKKSDSRSSDSVKRHAENSDTGTTAQSKKTSETIYDQGNEPNSDSLFDF